MEKNKKTVFKSTVNELISDIEMLEHAFAVSFSGLFKSHSSAQKDYKAFWGKVKKNKIKKNHENYLILQELNKQLKITSSAINVIPISLFISLIVYFEKFCKDLMWDIYKVKPETFALKDKTITLGEALEKGVGLATELKAKKFIKDSVEDRLKFFDWFDQITQCEIKNDPLFKKVVEVSLRRNLFVHNNGKIDGMYLEALAGHQIKHKFKEGDIIEIDQKFIGYFIRACNYLRAMGVILTLCAWKKFKPYDCEDADQFLCTLNFDFLKKRNNAFVHILSEFSKNKLEANSKPLYVWMYRINLALALKQGGSLKEALKILDSTDWTGCDKIFTLAIYVIKKDYGNAKKLMTKIGKKSKVFGPMEDNYKTWPLFKDFITSKQFLLTYKSIFGKNFHLKASFTPKKVF